MGMQRWIHEQLASSFSISCGFRATFLNKGLGLLCEKLFYPQKERFLPSQFELFLRLEQEISHALSSSDPLWQPLISYVQGKEMRRIALAQHLTKLFERYGIYANGVSLEWERKPSNWQEALWAKIYQDWDYPQRILHALCPKSEPPKNLSVHLFCFSHLSPLHFRFFCQVSKEVPVYIYQLSPCQEFWSDLPPDHPSLLGSLGKVGREMAKTIEASETDVETAYLLFGGQTQLKRLQRSLLTLQEFGESQEDDSLQVYSALTPHQEIENLHRFLHSLFSQGDIEPKDVIVMAPQITQYAPYIHAVFHQVPFQITDLPMQGKDPLVSGFLSLLELEKRRWSVPAVLELIRNPLFRKKQGFSEEECEQISKWVQKTGICWAVEGAHRENLLKKEYCQKPNLEERATWMEGFGHLIEELAYSREQSLISFSQAEFLGTLIHLIQKLYADLKELDMPKSLCAWTLYLRKLIEDYFVLEDPDILLSAIEKIEKAASHFATNNYHFSLIYSLLKEALAQESETLNRHLVQAVRFCSMLPMRAIPAKVICVLGMNHDAFPRKEELKSLDLLKQYSKTDYAPSRIDFDRYVFLEALLSAREKFLVSYVGKDPHDLTELMPSSVVAELLAYIPKNQVKMHTGYDLSQITIRPYSSFAIKVPLQPTLPKGEIHIDVTELARLVRSPLRHYLYFHELKILEEEFHQPEEPFTLTPLKKAILRKEALQAGYESALRKGEREGAFPLGLLGELAQQQLKEAVDLFPKDGLERVELKPLEVRVNSSLNVILTGILDGVFAEGLCIPEKFSLKNAVRVWPHFLLLNASDASKRTLFFAASQERKLVFFENPHPFLMRLIEHFFYAKETPYYFIPDWIEPILKKDPHKLSQTPVYDSLLQWQLRGKKVDEEALIAAYYPLLNQLYQEMIDAWK